MAICFLAFLFFGFILVNYLGKNMEGFARENPGRLTKCYSDGFFGSGYAWDKSGEVLECSDNKPRPNPGEIHSCNNVTRNKYICKDTGSYGYQTGNKRYGKASRVQWTTK